LTESTTAKLSVKPQKSAKPSPVSSIKPGKLASIPYRFVAFGIDIMIVALFTEALTFLSILMAGSSAGGILVYTPLFFLAFFFFNIFLFAYFIWFYTMEGKTLGKIVLGIGLVTYNGCKVSLLRSTLRVFGYYLSSFFFAGFLWAIIDKDAQGWHDKLAGTFVVDDDKTI